MIIISSSQKEVRIIYKEEKEKIKIITGKNSGSKIVEEINNILLKENKKIQDITSFGIDIGPGSFTGIRIGISVIQGLLLGRDDYTLKTYYSSDLLSYNYKDKKIAVLNKARDNAAYVTLYDYGKRISEPKMIFGELLNNYIKERFLIGEQSNHFKEKYNLVNNVLIPEMKIDNYVYSFENGINTTIDKLEPLYIQKPIAVENYEKQNNRIIEDI